MIISGKMHKLSGLPNSVLKETRQAEFPAVGLSKGQPVAFAKEKILSSFPNEFKVPVFYCSAHCLRGNS